MPRYQQEEGSGGLSITPGRIVALSAIALLCGTALISIGQIFENIPASQYVVIQAPFTGKLAWYKEPQTAWQGFGDVTGYPQRATYEFEDDKNGIELRFNDGGHATMLGSIQYELPSDDEHLTSLYKKFSKETTIHRDLIIATVMKSVYLSGPLMSSKESYAEKRNDLLFYIMDQAQNGVYKTRQKTEWVKDPVTNQDKQVTVSEIVTRPDGTVMREEESILNRYGIRLSNLAIKRMPYDKVVEDQIKQQQSLSMDVQTSIAELKKAEQRALTVEQQGRATAAEEKWKQEAIKAREVTKAEQEKQVAETNAARDANVAKVAADRDKVVAETAAAQRLAVAELDSQAAEQTKMQQIALGEGEAARKKLVLEADGALEAKLAAYKDVMASWAGAVRGTNMTPTVVMGGSGSTAASFGSPGAATLVDLLTAKTAKDLALDLSFRQQTAPTPIIPNSGVR